MRFYNSTFIEDWLETLEVCDRVEGLEGLADAEQVAWEAEMVTDYRNPSVCIILGVMPYEFVNDFSLN